MTYTTLQQDHHYLLEQLECAFKEALINKNFSAALKAKELQSKEIREFNKGDNDKISLKGLSKKGLESLLKEIDDYHFKHVEPLEDIKKDIKFLKAALTKRKKLQEELNALKEKGFQKG